MTAAPAVETMVDGVTTRHHGLDALRGAATLLVVFHHAAITYGASGDWFYKERVPPGSGTQTAFLTLFCATNQAWFMGLFFLLAGCFTPSSFDRKGRAGFWRDRLVRLGVPLLAFGVLLGPLTNALARTARGQAFWPALEGAYTHWRFELGPLWFAEALLLFTAVYTFWRILSRPARGRSLPVPPDIALLVAALLTGAVAFLLRLWWPVGETWLGLQLGYFASYVALFAAGCAASRGGWLERVPPSQRRLWLLAAALAFPVLPVAALWLGGSADGGWTPLAAIYAWWEPFVAWGVILGLLALFSRARWATGAGWRALGRRAFAIYVIHSPILVGVALAWRGVVGPPILKAGVTGVVACALCFVAADLLLRMPGVRRVL